MDWLDKIILSIAVFLSFIAITVIFANRFGMEINFLNTAALIIGVTSASGIIFANR